MLYTQLLTRAAPHTQHTLRVEAALQETHTHDCVRVYIPWAGARTYVSVHWPRSGTRTIYVCNSIYMCSPSQQYIYYLSRSPPRDFVVQYLSILVTSNLEGRQGVQWWWGQRRYNNRKDTNKVNMGDTMPKKLPKASPFYCELQLHIFQNPILDLPMYVILSLQTE